jgi:cytochrome c peroxidase
MHPLGEANSATGDPSALVVSAKGTVVVTLGGVGELAIGAEDDFSLYRLRLERRPTALTITSDSRQAFVANTFSDSISVVDLDEREVVQDISLGPKPPLTLADRGELLFYDATLSHDSWMSCNSCHTDGHTNGMLNDNFNDKSFGAPKRILSLLGRADTAPFRWNGSAPNLDAQVRQSIETTMQSDHEPKDQHVEALIAYLKTLPPPPSIDEVRGRSVTQAIMRGRAIFESENCVRCHIPSQFTSPETYDVGIHDKLGNKRFNPPSLIGVGQRGPYFHDNRAETLEEVFATHGHQLEKDLSDEELRDLIAFLRSL